MNKIRIAGAAAGVVLVSGVVLQVSSAAFTGETANDGNAWAAGTVLLSDDDQGQALYQTSGNLAPGDTETKCIEVTYNGTLDADVTLAAAVTPQISADGIGDGLDDELIVTIEAGPSGWCDEANSDPLDLPIIGELTGTETSWEVYSGTLRGLGASTSTPTNWSPTATGQSTEFRFTVTLDANADNDAQGDGATANFVWTASS